ncbi:TPA: hypothetical protein ACKPZ9_000115 [Stenotrophomonas maltophilia]|nr:hypothetical protein [Stenotrophomonas maltophilia]
MAFEICPQAADWGNWADWAAVAVGAVAALATLLSVVVGGLAAAATVAAVVVAVRTSRTAIDEARRMRGEDRAHQAEAERRRAVALALTFDHEFYSLGGLLRAIVDELDPQEFTQQPQEALKWLVSQMPTDPVPLLTRFAGDLDAFGPKDAGALLGVLNGWHAMELSLDDEEIRSYEKLQLHRLLHAMREGLLTLLDQLRDAREVTIRWMAEVRSDPPATDW